MAGGLTELMRIAALAKARGKRVVTHGYKSNITIAANLAFLAQHWADEPCGIFDQPVAAALGADQGSVPDRRRRPDRGADRAGPRRQPRLETIEKYRIGSDEIPT